MALPCGTGWRTESGDVVPEEFGLNSPGTLGCSQTWEQDTISLPYFVSILHVVKLAAKRMAAKQIDLVSFKPPIIIITLLKTALCLELHQRKMLSDTILFPHRNQQISPQHLYTYLTSASCSSCCCNHNILILGKDWEAAKHSIK